MNGLITTALVTVLATATPALASSDGTGGFTGVFMVVFLGYCAIIVVAQLLAALRALMEWANRKPAAAAPEESDG